MLQTNREEKLLNVDCQIRGKTDIHEALGSMTEVEIMEGDNQVFCDECKKNTDTVLRTAISTLPNMLILSLKRFDLDYTTFETVKLNSRCAFGQTLNMKQYTLEGLEALEHGGAEGGTDDMDTGTDDSATSQLPNDEYEYKLAGVLVHAGVAQGGHYYSFIKDRNPGSEEKWFRFDDEDVTPFDPASIEVECFGGKVKKETKWPNGQVHTVESEQYANALMLFYEKVKPTEPPPPSKDEKDEEKKKPIPKNLAMTNGFDVFEPDVKHSNATHRWQTFLFDTEFQAFLKGLLGLCRMSNTDNSRGVMSDTQGQPPKDGNDAMWKASVVQMLVTFVFDVLLYSNERFALGEWVKMLEETMYGDKSCARAFLVRVASKTKEISGNWLRTYLSDCPDQVARSAAVRIFSAAFRSCVTLDDEQGKLQKWKQGWSEQLTTIGSIKEALPCSLEGEWKILEDTRSDEYSALGTILSFVNVLIEASPRNWRYSPELNTFVRNLANTSSVAGGDLLRSAMIESLIPARMVCSVVRERAPALLRAAFPGSSVSTEAAESQIRPESRPVSQMMPMGGNHAMSPAEANYRGGGSPQDFLTLFEALGCLLGIKGIAHAPLVVDVDESSRGRQRVSMSDQAVGALRELFEEWCAPRAAGMGKREIEAYLQKCGIDSANLPTQKIDEIMAKYPTTGGSYLSLEGFLAYYEDTAQTNEMRVRVFSFFLFSAMSNTAS
jgi:ubiquitin carboxyl-terminal hydrolase 9/24